LGNVRSLIFRTDEALKDEATAFLQLYEHEFEGLEVVLRKIHAFDEELPVLSDNADEGDLPKVETPSVVVKGQV
jgi:hypothetical protein